MKPRLAPLLIPCFLFTAAIQTLRADDLYLETAVKLQTPKKDSKRSQEGGLEHVPFRIWLPEGVQTVRGVVFNPFYTKAVTQEHWQAACRQWNFGILSANFFGAKQTEFPELIDRALATFAEESHHPEIAKAKMCPVGMSAGAGMSVKITELMPERVIAAGPVCLEVGPRNAESMKVPIMTVFGERDGKQYEKLKARLPEAREQHALYAIAVQWRRRHEFARANNLLIPFFDAAIRQRLGAPGQPLREFDETAGWLGDLSNWDSEVTRVQPYDKFAGDKSQACWFPDEKTARAWQAFVTREPVLELKQPPGLGDGQPFILHRVGDRITVEGRLKVEQANSGTIEVYEGTKRVAELKEGTATIQFAEPGFYPVYLRTQQADGTVQLSRPQTLLIAGDRIKS